jgi:hypothetical protein
LKNELRVLKKEVLTKKPEQKPPPNYLYPNLSRTRQEIRNLRAEMRSATFGLISQDKPIISPDLDSKQAIFKTGTSHAISRGFLGDQEISDKLIMNRSPRNKPEISFGQEEDYRN